MFRHSIRFLVGAALCVAAPASFAQHADHGGAQGQEQEVIPYTADHCPISGEELGSMGEPVVREYDGREVRFCCKMCIRKFEADTTAGFEKLDKVMVEAQLPYYPLSTCIVSGEPLTEDGEDTAVNVIYKNRLVRFCCKSCVKDFRADPESVLKRLDAAVIAHQREAYPLESCPVSGEALGGMGEAHEVVIGSELVRLCCEKCESKLLADPQKYLAVLNAAWKKAGVPEALAKAPEADPAGHEGAGHHGG